MLRGSAYLGRWVTSQPDAVEEGKEDPRLDLVLWLTGLPHWAFKPPHTPSEGVPVVDAIHLRDKRTRQALDRISDFRGDSRPEAVTIRHQLQSRLDYALVEGLVWRAYHGRRLYPAEFEVYMTLERTGAKHPDLLRVCSHCRVVWEMERNRPLPIRPLCNDCKSRRRPNSPQRKPHHEHAWINPVTGRPRYWGWCEKCEGPFFAPDARTTHCRNCVGAGGQRLRRGGSARGRQRFVYEVVRPGALPDYLKPHLDEDHCVTDDAELAGFFDYLAELGLLRKL